MVPAEPFEAAEVPIGRDPIETSLDSDCGQKRIGNEIAANRALVAEPEEDVPMALSWRHDGAVGPS